MKYIRTKDGRIAEIKENMFVKQSDVLRLVYKDRPYSCVLNGNDEIIKQADTIDELCDVVVSIKKHKGTVVDFDILWSFLNWREELGEEIAEGAEIYGAIWTDKGLIYVAKMNEKGELELL